MAVLFSECHKTHSIAFMPYYQLRKQGSQRGMRWGRFLRTNPHRAPLFNFINLLTIKSFYLQMWCHANTQRVIRRNSQWKTPSDVKQECCNSNCHMNIKRDDAMACTEMWCLSRHWEDTPPTSPVTRNIIYVKIKNCGVLDLGHLKTFASWGEKLQRAAAHVRHCARRLSFDYHI